MYNHTVRHLCVAIVDRKKMEDLAAERFMWHKKALVSEKLVQEKMEMQILQLQVRVPRVCLFKCV